MCRAPALPQAAAKEFTRDGITVNAYCPGLVGTDMWVEINKRFAEITGVPIGATYEKYVKGIALGRAQTPEDVAAFVSFLAGSGRRLHDGAGAVDRRRTCLSIGNMRRRAACPKAECGTPRLALAWKCGKASRGMGNADR